jgi:hypothetical protein
MRAQHIKKRTDWKIAPFLRLLFPFITGILLQYYLPVGVKFVIPVFFLSFLIFIFCHTIPFSKFFGMEWIPGFVIQIAFLSFGRLLMFVHQDMQVENSPGFLKTQPNYLVLQVLGDPVQKFKSYKCSAHIRWLINN